MIKSFKVEIDPSKEQIDKINQNIGNCRFIYNFFLSKNKEWYKSEKKFVGGYDFSKWLNNEFIPNNPEYSWITLASSKALKKSIMNAEKAFRNFFKKKTGFPKFKKKIDESIKVYLPRNNVSDFKIYRHKANIPCFGEVHFKEKGYIPYKEDRLVKVKNCYVFKSCDRYYVIFTCEIIENDLYSENKSEPIGIDLGIKEFATISNGEVFENINKCEKVKYLKKILRRERRKLSRKYEAKKKRSVKGDVSRNIDKQLLKVRKAYKKLSDVRHDYINKVVNSLVKKNPQFIAIEDLKVRQMMKNKHLSKHIQESNFYYFREKLTQKCLENNIELKILDQYYPSSKICSNCGCIKKELKLSERTYKCFDCGKEMDRDLNASINIRNAFIN